MHPLKSTITLGIRVPFEIITKKISNNKTDSIFYAGENIARCRTNTHEYVLTTAGEYRFKRKTYKGIRDCDEKEAPNMTDALIKKLSDDDMIQNWGWFGMNVWELGAFATKIYSLDCNEVWSQYDEAIENFKRCVQEHIQKRISNEQTV